MSISILSNVSAMQASRQLGITNQGLQKTIQRLTTGKRINNANDDAAGLAIANGLTADMKIAAQGQRNVNDALTTLNTNDGYLQEATNLGLRATELAAQGASTAADSEWGQIVSSINAIMGKVSASVKAHAGQFGDITTTITATTDLAATSATAGANATAAQATMDSINAARSDIGAGMQSLQAYSNVLGIQVENSTAQVSQIMDADISAEVVNLSKYQILCQAGTFALQQANASAQSILSLLR